MTLKYYFLVAQFCDFFKKFILILIHKALLTPLCYTVIYYSKIKEVGGEYFTTKMSSMAKVLSKNSENHRTFQEQNI